MRNIVCNGAVCFYFFVYSRCRNLQGKQLFLCHAKAQIKKKKTIFTILWKIKYQKFINFKISIFDTELRQKTVLVVYLVCAAICRQ